MPEWRAVAVLPNIYTSDAFDGGPIAVTSANDSRVQEITSSEPKLLEFLSRFTDAFGVKLYPAILIVKNNVFDKLRTTNAIPSFRDLLTISVVPYARANNIVHKNAGNRIYYGASFWLYPWMIGSELGRMTLSTPALSALHVVEEFHGQSLPEMPYLELRAMDLDEVLFETLMKRWRRHYLTKRQRWEDRALFRSLNVATQATQPPGGSDTTLYDLCRNAALWVGAFEMLTHPRRGGAGLATVYPLLSAVKCSNKDLLKKKYIAHMGRAKKPWPRRTFPCWLYGRLYQARNKYIHGNPITTNLLELNGAKHGLFWLSAPLYRFALIAFLNLGRHREPPTDPRRYKRHVQGWFKYNYANSIIERALLGEHSRN
jgi:hypothetical protein